MTILFNQMFKFWGNPNQNVPAQKKPDVVAEERRIEEADLEDITTVLSVWLRAN